MSTEIIFDKAKIAKVEHKIGQVGPVTSRFTVVAIATAKIARAIGARWLLDKDALVKQGFTSVELDYTLKNVRAKHALATASLELVSERVTNFKVFRKGDDQKKAKRLMVSFIVHHSGSPFELLEHLMKTGAGEGVCTLEPMQAEMFGEDKRDALSPGALASAADVDRKASARRERAKKANGHALAGERVLARAGKRTGKDAAYPD